MAALTPSDSDRPAGGGPAHDRWSRPQGGFRLDWTPAADDASPCRATPIATEPSRAPATQDISGGNLSPRWNHAWRSGGDLQVQAYYDREPRGPRRHRRRPLQVDTYDLDVQHSFTLGARQRAGLGRRACGSAATGSTARRLQFSPTGGPLNLANVFVQDTISLSRAAELIAGPEAGGRSLFRRRRRCPSARLSWTPADAAHALGRGLAGHPLADAVRPGRAREARRAAVPDRRRRTSEPEKLTAYEVGRCGCSRRARLSFSVSAYYNVYDDLRTIEFTPVTPAAADTGATAAGPHLWRGGLGRLPRRALVAAVGRARHSCASSSRFKPGATAVVGVGQAGDDPRTRRR